MSATTRTALHLGVAGCGALTRRTDPDAAVAAEATTAMRHP